MNPKSIRICRRRELGPYRSGVSSAPDTEVRLKSSFRDRWNVNGGILGPSGLS